MEFLLGTVSILLISVRLVQENIGLQGSVIATITLGTNSSVISDPMQGGGRSLLPNSNPPTTL
jgi:hypothetical protein